MKVSTPIFGLIFLAALSANASASGSDFDFQDDDLLLNDPSLYEAMDPFLSPSNDNESDDFDGALFPASEEDDLMEPSMEEHGFAIDELAMEELQFYDSNEELMDHPMEDFSDEQRLSNEEAMEALDELMEELQGNGTDVREINLRHRALGQSGFIRPVFHQQHKCIDMTYSHGHNIHMYDCHWKNNQRMWYESWSQRIHVEGKCWDDVGHGSRNVYAHPCHGNNNQKWWFDNLGRIRGKHDNKCLEQSTSNQNVYMATCRNNYENQRWFTPRDFPTAKSEIKAFWDRRLCLDIDQSDNNLLLYPCHGGDNQQFYYSEKRGHIFVASGQGCMDYHYMSKYDYKVAIHRCHDGSNQKFYWDAEGRIRSHYDHSKCLESVSQKHNHMRMVKCSNSDRQRFVVPETFPQHKSTIVSARDGRCLDVAMGHSNHKKLQLHNCHGGRNQNLFYTGSERIIDGSGVGCAEADSSNPNNVKMTTCRGNKNQKWYTDNQGQLRNRQYPNECLTLDKRNNKLLILKECTASSDQTFLFPSSFPVKQNQVKPYHNPNLCMDINPDSGTALLWNCHGKKNQNFYYMADTKQVIVYQKGQAKCLDGTGDNVEAKSCNGSPGKLWLVDDKGRLQNGQRAGRCMGVDPKDNRNLIMAECSGADNQRFLFPAGFPHRVSVVKPFYDFNLCWNIDTKQKRNLHLGKCNGKKDQDFFFIPESERIISPSGLCMDDTMGSGRNVYFHPCHGGNNQKWFIDDRGRIHGRHDGKCLDSTDGNSNLYMNQCNGEETQRFIYSKSFVTVSSQIAPYSDPTKCWEINPDTNNLAMVDCHEDTHQDFFYIPESKQIIVASGQGCLDYRTGDKNVYAGICNDENDQKWYLDAHGRIHSLHDGMCVGVDTSNNNIRVEECDDGQSQRFSFPNSFPVVITDAKTAFKKRQELNTYYGETNRHVYGKETRSILRYNHPDQEQRNLCPYWESDFSLGYTMQNYKLSTASVIEVMHTSEMVELLHDDSRKHNAYVKKELRVLRPKQVDGFFRLGDFVTKEREGVISAVLVKGEIGTVLKKPIEYELVWNGTKTASSASATSAGSFWKPIPEAGYTCLGHVWSDEEPSTSLIRCIQSKFVEFASARWVWDNNDDASSAEEDVSVWATLATPSSITTGTFLSKASDFPPAGSEFVGLKTSCILGKGHFPFCGDVGNDLNLDAEGAKDFSLSYAKLQQCSYSDEDQEMYGLVNSRESKWKNHAIELHEYSTGSVGYKHVGASEHLGAPHCLGSVVFGSSEIKKDLMLHNITQLGPISRQEADDVRKGRVGTQLSSLIDGDFVFLFPCSDVNEVKSYKSTLQALAAKANKNGLSESGLVNSGEDLGELIKFGTPKWTTPHYCGLSEEPTESGGCRIVENCHFESGGCKTYDQLPCKENADCKGGHCSDDGLCGKNVRFYTDESSTIVTLPRAVSYGIGQDGPGRFLARAEGNQVQLSGNTWKAFPIKTHTIAYNTILEFDFRLVDEAEGHAICLDEDLNEDVEIEGSKRCFRLGGTQDKIWSEVWKLEGPGTSGQFKRYKIKVGSILDGEGPGGKQPYISWGARIKYLALVQDNDADETFGMSVFRKFKLYDDPEMPLQTVDPGPEITGESIMVDVDNTHKNQRWKVQCSRLDGSVPDQPPQSVYKHDGTFFKTSSAKTYKHKLDGLLPGYEYTTRVFPVDGNGNQVSKSRAQEIVASTHCCCDCDSVIVGDTTGRPIGLEAYQVDGLVMFKFTDNSRCAEAYAFTRSALEDEFFDNSDETRKSVFTPNYNYYPKKKCGMAPVQPGKAASDDLSVSKLEVGSAYRYCVRAVANFYSADSLHSSDENCNIHKVRWQASMSGKITTEPMAGGLPIEDVDVSWELMNPEQTLVIASGSAVTHKPGKFSIVFDELHKSLDRDTEFPVRIRFAKTTVVGDDLIHHQFLCNEGSTDCTDYGTIVYLKHLTFDEPVMTYDNSTVPVRGRVTIWEPDGCPVIGADVCLKIKHTRSPDTDGACVKTDFNGDYNVPATIGSRVGIQVTYMNHTITKAPENSMDYDKGMFINVNKRYERNDFVDTAKATLVVEVAGGLCNKTLGTSDLELTVNGCDADHWKMDLSQQFFKGEHWVPSHVVQVKVRGMSDDDNTDFSKVMESLYEEIRTIDLLEAGEMEEETERVESSDKASEEEKEAAYKSEESYDMVRFQYDGDLALDFRFLGADMAGDCTLETITPQGTLIADQQTTSSLHVTPTGSSFRPRVFLKYELLPELTCDIVSEDLKVRVVNKVGIDNDFDAYAPTLKDKGALLDRLKLCSDDGGCEFPVEHDMLNGVQVNANMMPKAEDGSVLSFSAGRPNIYGDFRKDLTVEVLGKDRNIIRRHKAEVVVVGDYVKGPGASFALPTYKPILVLRDPPGGLSQATYENVQTTIKVKSSSVERLLDTEFGFDASFGAEGEVDMCAGFGAMACSDVVEVSGNVDGGLAVGGSVLVQQNEDTYSSSFTTTWTYSTSDDPVLAGRSSDVIVIPNLNVQYHTVEKIEFFPTCDVNMTEIVKFSLTDPGNQPALSFLSVHSIEEKQIPELESAIASKKAEHDILEEGDAMKDKAKAQLKVLQDALNGWGQTMQDYDHINELASNNGLDIAGREWFSKWASKKDLSDKEPTITGHWANLAPESLTDRAEAFDFDYIKAANLASTDKEDLKQTNRIQFSGGGGSLEFALHHAGASELLRLDPSKVSADVTVGATLGGGLEFSAGATFGFELSGGFSYEQATSATITDGNEHETAVSFVFGDEQENDEFVVDIFVDPLYGTFVFNTVSGCSSAPHEENTLKGEDLRVALDRPTNPVMPDEPIVFHLTFGNDGEGMSAAVAAVDHTTNAGGLRHRLGGQTGAVEYIMGKRSEAVTTLEITRGPRDYLYPATTLEFGGSWDDDGDESVTVDLWNFQDADGEKWIKFEEPCPRVEWAGSLQRDKRASVIKDVEPVRLTVFNPRKADGTFESIAKNGRLNNVLAYYREIGDTDWKDAQLEDHTQIDFANIPNKAWKESVYGYANMPWDIGRILALTADGTYEVIVRSECTELSGAPADFNAYATEPITLVVDRVQPELYGKALPVRDIVVPGEEIVMVFTESIRCDLPYKFDLEVRVSGLEDKFDDRNLKINCRDRKLGFQFDPTRIRYDLLMGREMTVTVENVKDLEGNTIPRKIKFSKTIANLNLDEVTTSFDFTMNTAECAAPIDETSIREKIASDLALGDSGRVSVLSTECDGKDTVARVKIGPSARAGVRRLRKDQDDTTALAAVYSLIDMVSEDNKTGARKLISVNGTDPLAYFISNLEVLPGESDLQEYKINAEPTQEEEMIIAAAEGCDSHYLEHQQRMMKIEQSLKDHLNERESHLDRRANETASHIDELEMHLEMLDHKLDSKLDVGLSTTEHHIDDLESKLSSSVNGLSQELDQMRMESDAHIHELDHKLDEIVSHLQSQPKKTKAEHVTSQAGEKHSEASEMADLLAQMRIEQKEAQIRLEQQQAQIRTEQQQARMWNIGFGLCALAAIVASLYGKSR